MENKVEVSRSFSFKLNIGNYQSMDFFCAEKKEVPENEAEKASNALFIFCYKQVMKSVDEIIRLYSIRRLEPVANFETKQLPADKAERLDEAALEEFGGEEELK